MGASAAMQVIRKQHATMVVIVTYVGKKVSSIIECLWVNSLTK